MLALYLALACSHPDPARDALVAAGSALDRGDLPAFEAIVDVDAVVPEVARTCARVDLASALADAQFQPDAAPSNLIREVADAAAAQSFDDPDNRKAVVDDFRHRFPHLPAGACPALTVDRANVAVTHVDDDHATALVPVSGHDARWQFDLTQVAGVWHVTGAHGDAVLQGLTDEQLKLAHERATTILAGLAHGGTSDQWEAIGNYADHHPEDTALHHDLDALLAPFDLVTPPLATMDTGFFKPTGLFAVRHAATRVHDTDPRGARAIRVRFTFTDGGGQPVRSTGGTRAIVLVSGPVSPGGEADVEMRAGGWSWPDAVNVRATVIEVDWDDGTIWRHPAVDAGAWSALASTG